MRIEIECAGCKRMVLKSRTDQGYCPLCCRASRLKKEKIEAGRRKRVREICKLCGRLFEPKKEIKTVCYECVLKDIRERMMR